MRLLSLAFVLTTAAIAPCQQDLDQPFFFTVTGDVTEAQWEVLLSEFDMLQCRPEVQEPPFTVMVPPQMLPLFNDLGLEASLVPQSQFAQLPPPAGYFDVAAIEQEIDDVVAAFPNIASKVDISALPGATRTHENRPIYALKLSDNPGVEEDEPSMVFAAQHHAREVNSPYMVIGAMNRVANAYGSDPALTAAVDGYELYFVPMVNPDGVNHVWCCDTFWRKNRRVNGGGSFGVDLNRNYVFMWGQCGFSTNPNSDTYLGPSAGSEPETVTMRALFDYLRPEVYIDFHSFGREVLYLYPPCATVSSAIDAMADFYIDDLRFSISPSYATRLPSASAEAPHDSWGIGGAMSLLVEIGNSFQPNFSATITEEARVWPGLEQVMKQWRPAVTGHVRSIFQDQPLKAVVSYTPNQFSEGELAFSRARDGRYNLYLPIGTHTLRFEVAGYGLVSKTVTVNSFNTTQTIDIDLTPNSINTPTLTAGGSTSLGGTTTLTFDAPGEQGNTYWVALAGSQSPGLDLGGCREVPITPDSLFVASAFPNGLITSNVGIFGPSESATANLLIPNIPALSGLTLHSVGLTLDTQYNAFVKSFSSPVSVTFTP